MNTMTQSKEMNEILEYTADIITWWETNPLVDLEEVSNILEIELKRMKEEGETNV